MKKLLTMLTICSLLALTACGESEEHKQAVSDFNAAVEIVAEKNEILDQAISSAESVLNAQEDVYDPNTLAELTSSVSNGKDALRIIPEMPKKLEEIKAETEKLSEPLDYSSIILDIEEKQKAVEISIQQFKQITNPSEEFVIQCLQGVEVITGTQAVTEDNDPNGNLHKQGGYTSAVYFSTTWIDPSTLYGADIVDNGTDGGGCIEVYNCVEDAEKRNNYLASFDGAGFLNSGSHVVLGTIVIRTSSDLTATQQNDLTQMITDRFLLVE